MASQKMEKEPYDQNQPYQSEKSLGKQSQGEKSEKQKVYYHTRTKKLKELITGSSK